MALKPFQSTIIADVGISFGDEGKGRVVYEVADEIEKMSEPSNHIAMVLKVNGGANSGHTAGGLKHNLLPCGVVDSRIEHLAMGSGVVADPRKIWWEVKPIEALGYPVLPRLRIDERTQVSDLCHRLLDLAWEHYRAHVLKEESRGTTGRGITPAFSDEVNQWQIFFDVFRHDKESFLQRLFTRARRALATIQHTCQVDAATWDGFFAHLTQAELKANADSIEKGIFPASEFDFMRFKGERPFDLNWEEFGNVYWQAGSSLARQIDDVRELMLGAMDRKAHVICEFGQSYWLDKRQGFTPNVTASHAFTPELFQSAGIPLQPVHTIGVCKAYDTKVGTHVFITQMDDQDPITTRLKRMEYGTSTGRQRMVGWFDAVEKGSALRYGGFQDLVINKIDALTLGPDWQGPLKLCIAYKDDKGNIYHRVPRNDAVRRVLKPVYKDLPGWTTDLQKLKSFADFPVEAKRYVGWMLKALHDCANEGNRVRLAPPNIRYIGVGPDKSQIISDIPDAEHLISLAV